jgi:predicted SAM-dependent methyltransferase
MIIDTLWYLTQNSYYALQSALYNIGNPIHKHCEICGWEGKYFKTFYNHRNRMKESTVCPKCGSVDRTRYVYEYLKGNYNLKVLEVGTGEVSLLKKAMPDAELVTIDINGKADYKMDLTALSFKDNSFSLILCLAVLQEVENETQALKEMYRVLKSNGEVLIYVPLGYYKDRQGLKATEYDAKLYTDTRGSCRIYEKHDFTQKLQAVGFKVTCLPFETNGGLVQDNIIFRGIK